jgi:hypothetical protein
MGVSACASFAAAAFTCSIGASRCVTARRREGVQTATSTPNALARAATAAARGVGRSIITMFVSGGTTCAPLMPSTTLAR